MSEQPLSLAGNLRHTFDRSFAEAARREATVLESFLAIRVGGHPYALRLTEIAGLHAGHRIVAVPSRAPELLGIAGFRGSLVPVYGLRLLFGYPAGDSPRWLVLVGRREPLALAFDHFDGLVRVQREQIAPASQRSGPRHVQEIVQAEALLPVVDLPSIIDTITRRASGSSPEEHRS
jgi:chemotaxis signal transduction protein